MTTIICSLWVEIGGEIDAQSNRGVVLYPEIIAATVDVAGVESPALVWPETTTESTNWQEERRSEGRGRA
ncbi:hypothetical protein L1887_25041 [Cichorium endivia]|nr:hypothetical protein L1887_25041 [Cichorium endivia]